MVHEKGWNKMRLAANKAVSGCVQSVQAKHRFESGFPIVAAGTPVMPVEEAEGRGDVTGRRQAGRSVRPE